MDWIWVESAGGPILLLDAAALASWRGVEFDEDEQEDGGSDYDRACEVSGLLARLPVGRGDVEGLVLGEEPMRTAWVTHPGGGLLVRTMYVEDEAAAPAAVAALNDASFGAPTETYRAVSKTSWLFDSACPGADVAHEGSRISLAAGVYRVDTAVVETDDMRLVVHRLRRAD